MSEFTACETKPWTLAFDVLRMHMDQLNPFVYKRILKEGVTDVPTVPKNAKVYMSYTAFWEGETKPFDSSAMRDKNVDLSEDTGVNIMEALDVVVRTMRLGEYAEFLVSYHLLFHEAGCPPDIKPKADALIIVKVLSFYSLDVSLDTEDKQSANGVASKRFYKSYAISKYEANLIFRRALQLFNQQKFHDAQREFEEAKRRIETCTLADGREAKKQLKYIISIITNITICCLVLNNPLRTLSLCEELQLLMDDDNLPSHIQYIRGRAFYCLQDYANAKKYMLKALRNLPNSSQISNAVEVLHAHLTS